MKNRKKSAGGEGGGRGRVRGGGGGGCERRSELVVKIQKKIGDEWGWGVRMVLNNELKFCENSKENRGGGVGSASAVGEFGGRVGRSGWM